MALKEYKRADIDIVYDNKIRRAKRTRIEVPSFDENILPLYLHFISDTDPVDLSGAKIIMTSTFSYRDKNGQSKQATIIDEKRATILGKDTVRYELPPETRGYDAEINLNVSLVMPKTDGFVQKNDAADLVINVRKSALDASAAQLPDLIYSGLEDIVKQVTGDLYSAFTNMAYIDSRGHLMMSVKSADTFKEVQ